MPCYIVTYELKQPRREYMDFIGAIKSYDEWAQVLESTWAIVTDAPAVEVRDHLWELVHPDDGLFVVESGRDASWKDVRCENQWLRDHL
jgi:hypothetical protein